jgi:hypothetical protein
MKIPLNEEVDAAQGAMMSNGGSVAWQVREGSDIRELRGADLEREVDSVYRSGSDRKRESSIVAVRLTEMVIHNNLKLLGGANIRVDTLVVHGKPPSGKSDLYHPGTLRFPDIRDEQHLPFGEKGVLVYLGEPRYFVDFFITVSRDNKDAPDLHNLLTGASARNFASVAGTLGGVFIPGLNGAVLKGAISAAFSLGDLAHQVLSAVTGKTVGVFRGSWLEQTDNFGIGLHPASGMLLVDNLSFSFEILREGADSEKARRS